MGIKNLNKLWKELDSDSIKKIHLNSLANKKIAIDFNLYLYRFLLSNNNYLIGLFNQILKLLKYKIIPIYI